MYINREICNISILKKGSPEKIERQISTGEEEERDLRISFKFIIGNPRSRPRPRQGVRRGNIVLKIEPKEGDDAERDGEDDGDFPAEPDDVAAGDYSRAFPRHP